MNLFQKMLVSVSIPYLSGHPFLPELGPAAAALIDRVSIPYLSGHPFLPSQKGNPFSSQLCQSPIYRDTHFYYVVKAKKRDNHKTVSIPYLSGHPFLPSSVSVGEH